VVSDDSAFSLADFERYVKEHGIPEKDYPAAFAPGSPKLRAGRCRRSRRSGVESQRTGSYGSR
jgi:hypothetical protein